MKKRNVIMAVGGVSVVGGAAAGATIYIMKNNKNTDNEKLINNIVNKIKKLKKSDLIISLGEVTGTFKSNEKNIKNSIRKLLKEQGISELDDSVEITINNLTQTISTNAIEVEITFSKGSSKKTINNYITVKRENTIDEKIGVVVNAINSKANKTLTILNQDTNINASSQTLNPLMTTWLTTNNVTLVAGLTVTMKANQTSVSIDKTLKDIIFEIKLASGTTKEVALKVKRTETVAKIATDKINDAFLAIDGKTKTLTILRQDTDIHASSQTLNALMAVWLTDNNVTLVAGLTAKMKADQTSVSIDETLKDIIFEIKLASGTTKEVTFKVKRTKRTTTDKINAAFGVIDGKTSKTLTILNQDTNINASSQTLNPLMTTWLTTNNVTIVTGLTITMKADQTSVLIDKTLKDIIFEIKLASGTTKEVTLQVKRTETAAKIATDKINDAFLAIDGKTKTLTILKQDTNVNASALTLDALMTAWLKSNNITLGAGLSVTMKADQTSVSIDKTLKDIIFEIKLASGTTKEVKLQVKRTEKTPTDKINDALSVIKAKTNKTLTILKRDTNVNASALTLDALMAAWLNSNGVALVAGLTVTMKADQTSVSIDKTLKDIIFEIKLANGTTKEVTFKVKRTEKTPTDNINDAFLAIDGKTKTLTILKQDTNINASALTLDALMTAWLKSNNITLGAGLSVTMKADQTSVSIDKTLKDVIFEIKLASGTTKKITFKVKRTERTPTDKINDAFGVINATTNKTLTVLNKDTDINASAQTLNVLMAAWLTDNNVTLVAGLTVTMKADQTSVSIDKTLKDIIFEIKLANGTTKEVKFKVKRIETTAKIATDKINVALGVINAKTNKTLTILNEDTDINASAQTLNPLMNAWLVSNSITLGTGLSVTMKANQTSVLIGKTLKDIIFEIKLASGTTQEVTFQVARTQKATSKINAALGVINAKTNKTLTILEWDTNVNASPQTLNPLMMAWLKSNNVTLVAGLTVTMKTGQTTVSIDKTLKDIIFEIKLASGTTKEVTFKVRRADTALKMQKNLDTIITNSSYSGITNLNYIDFSEKFKDNYSRKYTWDEAKNILGFKQAYINQINAITSGYTIKWIKLEYYFYEDIKIGGKIVLKRKIPNYLKALTMKLSNGDTEHNVLLKRPHKKGADAFTLGTKASEQVLKNKSELVNWLKANRHFNHGRNSQFYSFYKASDMELLSKFLYGDSKGGTLLTNLNSYINKIAYSQFSGNSTKKSVSNIVDHKYIWGLSIDIDVSGNLLFLAQYEIKGDGNFTGGNGDGEPDSWIIKFEFKLKA